MSYNGCLHQYSYSCCTVAVPDGYKNISHWHFFRPRWSQGVDFDVGIDAERPRSPTVSPRLYRGSRSESTVYCILLYQIPPGGDR